MRRRRAVRPRFAAARRAPASRAGRAARAGTRAGRAAAALLAALLASPALTAGTAVLAAGTGVFAAGPAGAWPWRDEDVAAAERYREAERERALRYRSEVARGGASPRAAAGSRSERGAEPPRTVDSARRDAPGADGSSGAVSPASRMARWLARAIAGIEIDGATLRRLGGELRTWIGWWREEGLPRWHAIVAWIDRLLPLEPAPPEPASFASRAHELAPPREPVSAASATDPHGGWWAEERARLRRAGLEALATHAP